MMALRCHSSCNDTGTSCNVINSFHNIIDFLQCSYIKRQFLVELRLDSIGLGALRQFLAQSDSSWWESDSSRYHHKSFVVL